MEEELIGNVLVAQSGGPTSVINSSLAGVITEALNHDCIEEIYGALNGVEGILNEELIDLAEESQQTVRGLRYTPGAALGTCRYKLKSEEDFSRVIEVFKAHNIRFFFYIGGNDSMDTVSKLSRYAEQTGSDIRFIGIPKTIDNDLILTDHTPGFGSAAKFVASTVREIAVDASVYDNKQSVTIVEIMGRHAGWLTAASVLARKYKEDNPVLIYLPETAFDPEVFLSEVQAALEDTANLVVCVSEGINDGKGTFICELASDVGVDTFGHKMLTGSGKFLENLVRDRLGIKVRSIELNVPQRCSSAWLSATDLSEAADSGAFGVKCALAGETGQMISFIRKPGEDYELTFGTEDVNLICNQEKAVPREWISENGSDIEKEFIDYALPLIQGSVTVPEENGLPKFAYRK